MKTINGNWGVFLLLSAAVLGCNESKQPASNVVQEQSLQEPKRPGDDAETLTPKPDFKRSREAAAEKQQAEQLAAADDIRTAAEDSPAEPRRRTVFDSLYEAVRNGAAEALDENASSP